MWAHASDSTSASVNSDDVLQGVVPLLRVLWRMGVRAVVLGFPATSLVTSLPVGCAVSVSDHINLTGLNPLFGHNEDRYGPRFPDCSNLYNAAPVAPSVSDTTAVLASLSGYCNVCLPSEQRWLVELGAQLAVRGQAADAAIVAQQMGLRTTAVALVAFCAAADASDQGQQAKWLPMARSHLFEANHSFVRAIYNALGAYVSPSANVLL